ncbi:MAG: hypothetical protein M3R43_03990 [Acidobacteriota bacterium]|nr:hypothetical protein [Acidobacteriota bacterium]
MIVPAHRRDAGDCEKRRAAAVLLILALMVAAWPAQASPRGTQPVLKLKLTDLGYPGVSRALLDAGASMLTVHFVDDQHVLLTYSLRGLVERIPGDPPTDDDRAVAALLLELPSGKLLARTRWHLHDHGQYLWPLGGGRFLLRTRSTLVAVAPLANLATPEPFWQMPFAHSPDVVDAVLVSPEGDLVTLETSPPRKPPHPPGPVNLMNSPAEKEPEPPETFHFLRVAGNGSPESPVQSVSAGTVKTSSVGLLPVNGRGYLFAKSEKRSRWAMNFDSFDGETRKLSSVDSSCAPRMQFVSPSQFVVFSCRGTDEKIMISEFNFTAHETWEEPLSGSTPYAHFAFAPSAGRFAISRIVATTTPPSTGTALAPLGSIGEPLDPLTTQEVRIYQAESGDLLMKLGCVPVARSAQNFDLAPDGLSALVLRNGVIEVYELPPLSARDKQDLAEVQQHEPPVPHTSKVRLRMLLADAADASTESEPALAQVQSAQPAVVPVAPASIQASAGAASQNNASANAGDVQDTRRKPPSLLSPGEAADDARKSPNR